MEKEQLRRRLVQPPFPAGESSREVTSPLLDLLDTLRIPHTWCGPRSDAVRAAICSAYFLKAAGRRNGAGEYVGCRKGMPRHLHPSSALYGSGCAPDYVVCHEVVLREMQKEDKSRMEEEMEMRGKRRR